MKRVLSLILLFTLALSLIGCGSKNAAATPGPDTASGSAVSGVPAGAEETEPPKVTDSPVDGQMPDAAQPATPEDLKAIAEDFVDRPVEELYAAIGQPVSSSYAASCLGPGQDGELAYDGFTVYTYKEGDTETVHAVL